MNRRTTRRPLLTDDEKARVLAAGEAFRKAAGATFPHLKAFGPVYKALYDAVEAIDAAYKAGDIEVPGREVRALIGQPTSNVRTDDR